MVDCTAAANLSRVDEEGYISIVDRKKNILTAGFNVCPAEIEPVFAAHDGGSRRYLGFHLGEIA